MDLLKIIQELPNGARFYNCDLHNHTPKDNNFNSGGFPIETEEQKQNFAREYIRFAIEEKNLDILGITEHNDTTWLPYLIEAAKGTGLIIFPGVEVGAEAGQTNIHFLALFNPATNPEDIDHWISSLELLPRERFHDDGSPKIVKKSTYELTEQIVRNADGLPGIAIAAHASSNSGLFHEIEGEGRINSYKDKNMLVAEIPGKKEDLGKFENGLVNGKKDNYGNKKIACINSSDGRCIVERDDIPSVGSKTTYIKLSAPTVEGLRQAFIDFESRIRLKEEISDEKHPVILGIAIEGAFLNNDGNDFLMHLNPNLNCIIGGRGTGKSALIEAVRYAFDIPYKTDSTQDQSLSLIENTLMPGSKIIVFFKTSDGTVYRIERTKGEVPKVYNPETSEEIENLLPNMLIADGPLDIYSQKEIYEISKNPEFQLSLIDNYLKEELRHLIDDENIIIAQIKLTAQDIINLENDVVDTEERLKILPALLEELERLEKSGIAVKLTEKQNIDREKIFFEQGETVVMEVMEKLEIFKEDTNIEEYLWTQEDIDNSTNKKHIATQQSQLIQVQAELDKFNDNLKGKIQKIIDSGIKNKSDWLLIEERINGEYQRILIQNPDTNANRIITLTNEIASLLGEKQQLTLKEEALLNARGNRNGFFDALETIRKEKIFSKRIEKVTEFNTSLGEKIKIEIQFQGNRAKLINALDELLSGSGARATTKEEIANSKKEDGSYYSPHEIAEAIREEKREPSGENNILSKILVITPGMQRVILEITEDRLLEFEQATIPDLPIIYLKVGDEFKPLDKLSVGQKCTAILSIILVDRNTPLLIDQPEDDLDNRFIFEEIVKTLRVEKEKRQFLIATHNANIPVSGDAELIIVLDADEESGWVDCAGSIDDDEIRDPVEKVLEGGRRAFKIRKEKYGI